MEAAIARGTLVLKGEPIEAAASEYVDFVGSAARQRRVQRDGCAFHLTLLHKGGLPSDAKAREALLEEANTLCRGESFLSLGLGLQGPRGKACMFVVVLWPSAQAFCRRHGRSEEHIDLHITLGFDGEDLHGVRKGVQQLEQLPVGAAPAWSHDGRRWPLAHEMVQTVIDDGKSIGHQHCAGALAIVDRLIELFSEDAGSSVSSADGSTPPSASIRAKLFSARCQLLGKLGRAHEALEAAKRAASLQPAAARPLVQAGAASIALTNFAQALVWLRRAQMIEGDGALTADGEDARERVSQLVRHCEKRLGVTRRSI